MPRRSILTERQRSALFDLPTDDASMLHHLCIPDLLRFPRCSVLQGTASGKHTP